MNILIQLGSCGASWPENTTPIQRMKAISSEFERVILVDTAPEPTKHLPCDAYVQIKKFSLLAIARILFQQRSENMVIWFGPSPRIAIVVLMLRLFMRFHFILDLYDHERLSSGIAKANGTRLKALKYWIFEGFTALAARRADLLVSAISEERYFGQPNRVKVVNGVATDLLRELDLAHSFATHEAQKTLTVCYVGLVTKERANLLADISGSSYGTPVELLLIGDNDPNFVTEIRQKAADLGEVSIAAPGFVPWSEAMRLVAGSDVCLYVFPTRPELDCVYPIKMGEYMELKKPVIAADSTAIREVFSDCPGVIRCDTDRPQDWILAIQTLLGDAKRRHTLGISNQSFAREQLDWDFTQAELMSRLRTLLSSNVG